MLFFHVGGAANVTIVSCKAHPDYEFKTLAEIAEWEHVSPVALYMKIVRDGGASVVCRSMKEADIRSFYQQPPNVKKTVPCRKGIAFAHCKAAKPRIDRTYPRAAFIVGAVGAEMNQEPTGKFLRRYLPTFLSFFPGLQNS